MTDSQGEIVVSLWNELGSSPPVLVEAIIARIIHPSIEQINNRCGQRIDEHHLAATIAEALRQRAQA